MSIIKTRSYKTRAKKNKDLVMEHKNILGEELKICGCDPMTGWKRDGFCKTEFSDRGVHTVCCVVTEEFLSFSKSQGNDLSTPRPEFGFTGLKAGDHWCVCAGRWFDAYKANKACPVILEATHEETLAIIPFDALEKNAFKENLQ